MPLICKQVLELGMSQKDHAVANGANTRSLTGSTAGVKNVSAESKLGGNPQVLLNPAGQKCFMAGSQL